MLAPLLSADHYAFNPHAVPLFITAAITLLLGILTIAREKGSRAASPLTVLILALFIWVFAYAWMYLAIDPEVAMDWGRLAHVGIIIIPAATYHFTVVVADRAEQFKLWLRAVWGITLLFIALCFGTDWFLAAPEVYPWSYHPRYGWAGLAFVIFLALIWIIDVRIFWQAYRRARPGSNNRRRAKYLGLFFTMGIFGGADFAPAFGIPLLPLGYLGVVSLTALVAYVTWRYRLIDITPAYAAQKIIETINDGLVLLDTDGIVRLANQPACDMLGYDNKNILDTRLGEALGLKADTLQSLLDGKPLSHYETVYPRPDGANRHFGIAVSIMRDRDGTPATFVCVLRDITENKHAEEQIRQLAYYDSLTQLPNREHFRQRLEAALVAARCSDRQLAILFLDLDHFKRINDSLGHSVGDQLLHLVAERLRQSVRDAAHSDNPTRDNESLVARLGGDEFVIVAYPLTRAEEARQIAERLLRIFLRPFRLQEHEVFVGASIGISLFPRDGANAEDLLKHADTAMYAAKGAGRGGHQIYETQMSVGANERFSLESALHKAIAEEQLLLHYQAQFDVRRQCIIGVEALLRWHHPQRGLLRPDAFLNYAEESGLIIQIGEWALRNACRQATRWHAEGWPRLRVAVNVSKRQLRHPTFTAMVKDVLHETGLPAHCLALELTESALTSAEHLIVSHCQTLAQLGIRLIIDDFATGYSSLRHLKQLAVSGLKIDRVFLRDVTHNAEDAAIASAIIALARGLDLEVIAEGVENQAQLDFLLEHECRLAQGQLLGAPVSAAELMAGAPPLVIC